MDAYAVSGADVTARIDFSNCQENVLENATDCQITRVLDYNRGRGRNGGREDAYKKNLK